MPAHFPINAYGLTMKTAIAAFLSALVLSGCATADLSPACAPTDACKDAKLDLMRQVLYSRGYTHGL